MKKKLIVELKNYYLMLVKYITATIIVVCLYVGVILVYTGKPSAVEFGGSIPTISPLMYFGGSNNNVRLVSTTTKLLIGSTSTTTDAMLEVNGDIYATTGNDICINGGNCLSSVSSGSATTTITTNVQSDGPDFTFTTSSTTGLDFLISASGSVINFAPALQANYSIPLTASTTEWSNFYATPSTRITAGTGLSWSGNTLNSSNSFTGSGTNGYVARWASSTGLTTGILLDNGTVSGVNATSATTTFNIQGASGVNPFNIASSTGSSLLTVLQNGNVGIGTIVPVLKLQISGLTAAVPAVSGSTQSNGGGLRFTSNSAAVLDIGTAGSTGGWIQSSLGSSLASTYPLLLNPNGGNVGIGTVSPTYKLEVSDGTNTFFNLDSTLKSAKIGLSESLVAAKTLDVAGDINFDTVDKPSAAQLTAMTLTEDPNAAYNLVATKQYYYGVSFITSSGDTDARGSGLEKSITIGATNARVLLANIPTSTDPRVTGRKIYRSQGIPGGNGYLGYRVTTINDNTTTTYTDNTADASLVLTDGFYRKDNTTVKGIYVDGTLFGKMGTWNVSYGYGSLQNLAGGTENVAIGMSNPLVAVTTGSTNVGIGSNVLLSLTTGSNNIGIGYSANNYNQTGSNNVSIGTNAVRLNGGVLGSVTGNTGIGTSALYGIVNGNNYNTGLGYSAGAGFQGNNNIMLGANTGSITATTTGNYNLFIGDDVGDNVTAGADNNILIGKQLDLQVSGGDNQLSIGNLIFGTGLDGIGTTVSSGKIGIGTSTPAYKLDVKGDTRINSDTTAVLKVNSNAAVGIARSFIQLTRGLSPTENGWDLSSNLSLANDEFSIRSIVNSVAATLLTILTNGNVGIGTTTPAQTLVVAGDARVTGAFFDSTNASGTTGLVLQSTGTSTKWVATSTLGISGGSGITSLGGQTGATQTFASSTTGNLQLFINSTGDVHTFTLQPATNYQLVLTASTTEWAAAYAYSQVGHLPLAGGIVAGALNASSTLAVTGAATFYGNLTVTTGLVDFGSAVLEISNGTNPTANNPGELAHDTTDNQLILDDYVVGTAKHKIWSTTIASTSPAFINSGLLPVPQQIDGYTITNITCFTVSGTNKVIAVEDASANSSEDITCDSDGATDDGSITNATYTASELSFIDFGATSGAVDYVTISVFGTWTRE